LQEQAGLRSRNIRIVSSSCSDTICGSMACHLLSISQLQARGVMQLQFQCIIGVADAAAHSRWHGSRERVADRRRRSLCPRPSPHRSSCVGGRFAPAPLVPCWLPGVRPARRDGINSSHPPPGGGAGSAAQSVHPITFFAERNREWLMVARTWIALGRHITLHRSHPPNDR
jgi:hypothetical protein